jgi:DNA-binding transcriptional ArsR family regulator
VKLETTGMISSSKDIGNHGGGSVESEKELDDLLGALDNPNRMRILKFLLEGEKSRSYTSHPYIIDHIDSMSYNSLKGSLSKNKSQNLNHIAY